MPTPSTNIDLAAEFEKRGPWTTRFVVEGKTYGGEYLAAQDARIPQFFEAFPDGRIILDLGALEGGHAFAMSKHGVDRIVAVEGRASNITRARFVRDLLKIDNVELVCADLEKADLTELGLFDAIFCCGILYHLPRPWELIKQMSAISPRVFIWTHYALETEANLFETGYRGRLQEEVGLEDPWGGLSPTAFWPTLESLHKMLGEAGYNSVRVLKDDPQCQRGPAVLMTATRGA